MSQIYNPPSPAAEGPKPYSPLDLECSCRVHPLWPFLPLQERLAVELTPAACVQPRHLNGATTQNSHETPAAPPPPKIAHARILTQR